jgi:hypothetical protein
MRRRLRWWYLLVLVVIPFAVAVVWTLVRRGAIDWQRAMESSSVGTIVWLVLVAWDWLEFRTRSRSAKHPDSN